MRKLNRSVAKSYARELGMKRLNKRRAEAKTINLRGMQRTFNVRVKSVFGEFYAKLNAGLTGKTAKAVAKIERQRWNAAAKVLDAQGKARNARQAKLNAKAAQFPAACGVR